METCDREHKNYCKTNSTHDIAMLNQTNQSKTNGIDGEPIPILYSTQGP